MTCRPCPTTSRPSSWACRRASTAQALCCWRRKPRSAAQSNGYSRCGKPANTRSGVMCLPGCRCDLSISGENASVWEATGSQERVIESALAPLQSDLPGVLGPAPLSLAFAETWQRRTGRTFQPGMRERLFELTAVSGVSGVPGHLRAATTADRDLLVTWVDAFFIEAAPEPGPFDAEGWVEHLFASPLRGAYLWEDGAPVSLACSGGPTPNGARIGPVYTPPDWRGHGYASAATAVLSQLLLERGRRFCFLFTDLTNPTSNHIYQAIGYQPVCDVDIYHFAAAR